MFGHIIYSETESGKNNEFHETKHSEISKPCSSECAVTETKNSKISEMTFNSTIESITSEYGEIIPEEQRIRIDIESDNYKPTVLSLEEYSRRFPEEDVSVLGHYDVEGRVYLKEGSPEMVKHVTTHEAVHLTSYKEIDNYTAGREVYRSGIRETVYGENGLAEDRNQALNEGITELYAIRELISQGDIPAIEAVTAYPEAQVKAYELQKIVGEHVIQEAYFGGNYERLSSEVNRLSYGDETAWKRYSHNVDVLEYGTGEAEVADARRKLTIQNAIMTSFLESEAQTEIGVNA